MEHRGPSDSTLRSLHGMLPSLKVGIEKGKISGGGHKVATLKRPRKNCPVCLTGWDWAAEGDEFQMQAAVCERCEGLLKEGFIALVCGGEYAFAKHPHLADMSGTIQRVKPETFEKLRGKFAIQRRGSEPAG